MGGEVDPMPEILFFDVAADEFGDEGLFGEEVGPAFVVGVGDDGLVGGDGVLELDVAVDARPF